MIDKKDLERLSGTAMKVAIEIEQKGGAEQSMNLEAAWTALLLSSDLIAGKSNLEYLMDLSMIAQYLLAHESVTPANIVAHHCNCEIIEALVKMDKILSEQLGEIKRMVNMLHQVTFT